MMLTNIWFLSLHDFWNFNYYVHKFPVKTSQLYKCDEEWEKYPVYALHFRLNGIKEINPYDHFSREAIQQIMMTECEADIIDIIYCEKMNRYTYVVNVRDENGLNVAETLISKNYALPINYLEKKKTITQRPPSRYDSE